LDEKKNLSSPFDRLFADFASARWNKTPFEEIECINQFLLINDQQPMILYNLGNCYTRLLQYEKSIVAYEKSLAIYERWKLKPNWVFLYTDLGTAYHKTGQFKKEKLLYKKAEQDFPDSRFIIYQEAVLALCEKDTILANKLIKRYASLCKDVQTSEAFINMKLAFIFKEANLLSKAEDYFRQSAFLQKDEAFYINQLAYFLIDSNRNIAEGMEIAEKALFKNPDNYRLLATKGWGLYKIGKFEEALAYLKRSWALQPEYDREIFLQIEEVKMAISKKLKRL
jgi:tetratricopeptide (TPR) repeat protein